MSDKKTKDPLLEDENQPKKVETTKPIEEEKKVEIPTPPPSPKVESLDEAERTKAILATKPHINFLIPLMEGEKPGASETVQINGYKIEIQKGVMVNIPLPVANILAEKYRIQMEAGRNSRIDRDEKTSEALG